MLMYHLQYLNFDPATCISRQSEDDKELDQNITTNAGVDPGFYMSDLHQHN